MYECILRPSLPRNEDQKFIKRMSLWPAGYSSEFQMGFDKEHSLRNKSHWPGSVSRIEKPSRSARTSVPAPSFESELHCITVNGTRIS